MRADKPRLVLILPLIGLENGASLANQSQSVVKNKQNKQEITLKTAPKGSPVHGRHDPETDHAPCDGKSTA